MKLKRQRWLMMTLLIVLTLILVSGCGGGEEAAPQASSDSGTTTTEQPVSTVPPVQGELYETEKVSMIVADGWNVMDIDGGLQAYQGSRAVEVWVRGSGQSENAAKESMEKFSSDYDGTPVMDMEAFGLTFYTTSYNFSGMEQTKLAAIKDGEKVEITVSGSDHINDDIMMGMLDSIMIN